MRNRHPTSEVARRIFLAVVALTVSPMCAALLPAHAQAAPSPVLNNKNSQKYVNEEFGFSFSYPADYKPSDPEGVCSDNQYRAYLLCLSRKSDPDSSILVTLVLHDPFFIGWNAGGNEYQRRKIGAHDFYCGLGGSMGTSFYDECVIDFRGRRLEFVFPQEAPRETNAFVSDLELRVLQTFRVQRKTATPRHSRSKDSVVYDNTAYGFSFFLPQIWKGYSVTEREVKVDGTTIPAITICRPDWTQEKQFADVSILVFSTAQWDSLSKGDLALTSPHAIPTELAHNSIFVFATPADTDRTLIGNPEIPRLWTTLPHIPR